MNVNDANLQAAAVGRKIGSGSKYNFDLEPLISNFDFYDFFYNGMRLDADDYGAFAVLTTKQYILGYNAGFGFGSHYSSYARVLKDISGGGDINNDRDLAFLSFKCQNTYITIRICCEKIEQKYASSISVKIPKNGINQEQFHVFEKFYEDYNKEIEKMCNKFNCRVSFSKNDGTYRSYVSNNLDEVMEYLRSIVNKDLVIEELFNEKIIGVMISNSNNKKR